MIWFGFMCVTKRRKLDTAISDKPVEYSPLPAWDENRQILTNALRNWLFTADFYYDRPELGLRHCPEAKPDVYP